MSRQRQDVGIIEALLAPLSGDLVELLADEEFVRALGERAAPLIEPDAPVTFHGADAVVLGGQYRGFAGLVAGWREWLSTFAAYHFVVEDAFREGDRIVVLVRQKGRTIHGDVEVPSSPSAAVFTLREGRLCAAAFYLDRAEAAKTEDLDLS